MDCMLTKFQTKVFHSMQLCCHSPSQLILHYEEVPKWEGDGEGKTKKIYKLVQ